MTEDGLNFVYQINYYGGFLLTHLLLGMSKICIYYSVTYLLESRSVSLLSFSDEMLL
nr:unnamed protein product [Callosobruchus chinensis]